MNGSSLLVVLIVDDNPDDSFFTKRALISAGIKNPIVSIESGEEAIAFLKVAVTTGDLPCVAFLDLKMPMLGGFEILIWAKQQIPLNPVKFVVLSGSDEPSDHRRALELGADGYLVKFPTAETLAAVVVASTECIKT